MAKHSKNSDGDERRTRERKEQGFDDFINLRGEIIGAVLGLCFIAAFIWQAISSIL